MSINTRRNPPMNRNKTISVSAGLNDLNPHDKAKIARLVEQVMKLTHDNESLKNDLINSEEIIKEKYQQKMEKYINEEMKKMNEKRQESLLLLKKYQEKVQFFSDELVYTRKAYDDLSQRYNVSQENINELEVLLDRQKQTIDSEKNKHQSLQNSTKEIQELKDELRHRNEDCVRYKTKFESLESTSNYLASQLDSLLSQLTEKTNRIKILEDNASKINGVRYQNSVVEESGHSHEISQSTGSTQDNTFVTSRNSSEDIITGKKDFNQSIESPPVQPRKVHTPEQLLESWSEENWAAMREDDAGNVNEGNKVDADATRENSKYPEEKVNSFREEHDLYAMKTIKSGVAYNMNSDMLSDVTKDEKIPRDLQTQSSECGNMMTLSMREASGVQFSSPPPPLTPPRKMYTDGKVQLPIQSSIVFNDSSLEGTLLYDHTGESSNNTESELTDRYFLETVNGHIDSTGRDVVALSDQQSKYERPINSPLRHSKESVEVEVPSRKVKRPTMKSGGKSSSTSASAISRHPKVTSQSRGIANSKKGNKRTESDKVKKISKTDSHHNRQISAESNRRQVPIAVSRRGGKTISQSEQESPGLKAWEEASKNFDGYGIQLFDVLDQLDEGVHTLGSSVFDDYGSGDH